MGAELDMYPLSYVHDEDEPQFTVAIPTQMGLMRITILPDLSAPPTGATPDA